MKEINVRQLIQGNKQSWDSFVSTMSPLLFHIIKKTLSCQNLPNDDVYDYLQDIFLHFCKDNFHILKEFDPRRSQLSTWCGVVARNKVLDRLRKKSLTMVSLDEEHDRIAGSDDIGLKDKFMIPVDLLSPRQQIIMRLIYEKDLDVAEVAELLSISRQTVRSLRHKALLKLREFYKQ